MHRYRIQLLGTHAVYGPTGERIDFPSGKSFALLAFLLLQEEPISRASLGGMLWPESARERRQQSVRQALLLIRRVLGEGALEGDDLISVNRDLVTTDVAEIMDASREQDASRIERLWTGALLGNFVLPGVPAWDDWADEHRARVARIAADVLRGAAHRAMGLRETTVALRWLSLAVRIHPHEVGDRVAMIATLLAAGRISEAEQVLTRARHDFSEAENRRTLDACGDQIRDAQRSIPAEPAELLSDPEFIGRARELSILASRWNRTRRGGCHCVVVRGIAGTGKTRLVRELLRIVENDGGRTVIVKTTEPERGLQWGAVGTLVQKLLRLPGAGGTNDASQRILDVVVPSAARSPGNGGVMPDAAPLADAVLDLIGAVTYEGPLAIVLDDVQWVDGASAALLTRVMTQAETGQVLFVVTVRADAVGAAQQRSLRRLEDSERGSSIEISNFTLAEMTEFLAYNAGVSGESVDDASLVARLHAFTHGSPLFIVETLKAFHDADLLTWRDGQWKLHPDVARDGWPMPRTIDQLVTRRIQDLTPAALHVAVTIAGAGVLRSADLVKATALKEGALADALIELGNRGVISSTEDGYIPSHDAIADVLRSLPARTRRGRWLRSGAVAAVILLLIAASAFLWSNRPRYGGGAVHFVSGDSVLEARPPRLSGGAWTTRALSFHVRFGRNNVQPPFRTVYERYVWFGAVDTIPDVSPYVAEFFPDGTHHVIERSDANDSGFSSLSPDGRTILYDRNDPFTEEYDLELVLARRDGSQARTLRKNVSTGVDAQFSPNGLLIGVATLSRQDSLLIMTALGSVRHVEVFGTIHGIAWCGNEQLAVLAAPVDETEPTMFIVDLETGARRLDLPVVPAKLYTCSPDGSAILASIINDGTMSTAVIRAEDSSIDPFPHVMGAARWLPERIPAVPTDVEAVASRSRIDIGESATLSGILVHTDGRRMTVPLKWESRAPDIVSVLSGERAVGNRPGTATLVATYADAMIDSVQVTVSTNAVASLLVSEVFSTLDESRWFTFGVPAPQIVTHAGERVLHLTGDGNYLDGILYRTSFSSGLGLTLEVDFKLDVTAAKWQRIQLGFCTPTITADGHTFDSEHVEILFGVSYPARELVKFNASELMLTHEGSIRLISVPGLPARGWTHLALQLQPDGYTSVAVNHRRITTSQVRSGRAAGRWHPCVSGASVGSRLLVRNLRLWEGVRY